jgi:hypothetical protein
MFPHIGPEFVEALLYLATKRSTTDTSEATSQNELACKRVDRFAPLRRVTLVVLSRILAVVRTTGDDVLNP